MPIRGGTANHMTDIIPEHPAAKHYVFTELHADFIHCLVCQFASPSIVQERGLQVLVVGEGPGSNAALNAKWITDIAEFKIQAGKVYLSPTVDCFDVLLPSWTISTSLNCALVNSILDAATSMLKPDEHPIIHSDSGAYYLWPGRIASMEKAGLSRSISHKGYSPNNAALCGVIR